MSIYTLELSPTVGYPLELRVHGLQSSTPLYWESWSAGECVAQGGFLKSPRLPVRSLLTEADWLQLDTQIKAIIYIAPWLQCQLLQVILLSNMTRELALSSPLLFLLLVDYACKEKLTPADVIRLAQLKRSVLLQHIMGDGHAGVLNVLARTQVKRVLRSELDRMVAILKDEARLRLLRHVPQPCLATYVLLEQPLPVMWVGLLTMLPPHSGAAQAMDLVRLLVDTHRLGASPQRLRALTQYQQLEELHNELIIRFHQENSHQRANRYQAQYGDYPKAPIEGNSIIVPIQSWYDLLEEGRQMRHCVGSYHQSVSEGQVFIYQVHVNPRLTLAIKRTDRGWALQEIRAYANQRADDQAVLYVHQWLRAAQVQIS